MMPEVFSHLISGSNVASRKEPARERATIFSALSARSSTRREMASTSLKSARIASHMICREMDTMWAWRICRRSMTWVSSRRKASSPDLGWPA